MNKLAISFFLAALILAAEPCLSAGCPDLDRFFKEIDPAQKTWKDLYRLYTGNPSRCDDGIYAEGYSDFTAQSLAKYWDRFDELGSLVERDPDFKKFVLKHVDPTVDEDDLTLLLDNARNRCPSDQIVFCRQIEKAAVSALKELETYQ